MRQLFMSGNIDKRSLALLECEVGAPTVNGAAYHIRGSLFARGDFCHVPFPNRAWTLSDAYNGGLVDEGNDQGTMISESEELPEN